ncbi:MAG: DUF4351 domain-containing protein [Abditibacteriales bacterium]|nr:DUF4351 domain-containing protein [Abditibacteriales bacterium]MDW8365953.1 hypothetical protein [Abditibacteriales bacterium]
MREADVVVEVKTLHGESELLLIHVEIEAERRKDFAARMFRYDALLWLRHRLPIFPIVVYLTSGAGGLTQEEYRADIFGREVVRFRYECIGLGDEVREMQMTWADRMKLEGEVRGKREALLRQLSLKFGPLPEEVTARVQAIGSEELDAYLDRILFANSLAEMGLEGAGGANGEGEQN